MNDGRKPKWHNGNLPSKRGRFTRVALKLKRSDTGKSKGWVVYAQCSCGRTECARRIAENDLYKYPAPTWSKMRDDVLCQPAAHERWRAERKAVA